METLEKTQLEVQQDLYQLDADNLRKICGSIPEIQEFDEKTKRQLIRLILNHLESDEVAELEDGGMATLLSLQDQINEMLKPAKEEESDNEEEKKQEEMNAILEAHKKEIAEMEKKLKAQMAQLSNGSTKKGDSSSTQLFRKDCRISGQIGGSTQKDRLSFSSLNHQINAAAQKGYSEGEIVEAVIRAVNPGIPLRSVLEGSQKLTLEKTKAIIGAHYQERDATDCYQSLSELRQEKQETPQDFVMKAIDLKQKIVLLSTETTSGPVYDPKLVQGMFLRTMATGLRDDNVRLEIKPYLVDGITDEVLLQRINVAASLESKRQKKTDSTKNVRFNKIEVK